jgi:hypothetical protein
VGVNADKERMLYQPPGIVVVIPCGCRSGKEIAINQEINYIGNTGPVDACQYFDILSFETVKAAYP